MKPQTGTQNWLKPPNRQTIIDPHWTFLNHILIIGKQVIYSSRLRKSKPLFSQFIVKLKYIEHIEHYIAKRRDRINFHEKKWKIIRK